MAPKEIGESLIQGVWTEQKIPEAIGWGMICTYN